MLLIGIFSFYYNAFIGFHFSEMNNYIQKMTGDIFDILHGPVHQDKILGTIPASEFFLNFLLRGVTMTPFIWTKEGKQ